MISGDCLFHAFAKVIQVECGRKDITSTYLRKIVSNAVLRKDDERVNNAIDTWINIHDELEKERLIQNGCFDHITWKRMQHVHVALENFEKNMVNLDLNTVDEDQLFRQYLARAMMDPSLYWGDEFSLYVLEREFKIYIVVLQPIENSRPIQQRIYVPKTHINDSTWTNQTIVIFVRHEDEHYEPVSMSHEPLNLLRSRYVWFFHELPLKLRRILSNNSCGYQPEFIRASNGSQMTLLDKDEK